MFLTRPLLSNTFFNYLSKMEYSISKAVIRKMYVWKGFLEDGFWVFILSIIFLGIAEIRVLLSQFYLPMRVIL